MTAARRIRILYPASMLPGGAERQMLLLTTHLPRDRFEISFVLLGGMTPLAEEARRRGATVHVLGAPRRAGMRFPLFAARVATRVATFIELCRRERYDVVDAWLYLGYAMTALTRPLTRIPVLISGRRSLSDYKRRFGLTERAIDVIARRWSDAFVANSEAVAENVARLEGIERSRLRVIRNGVEIPPVMDPLSRQRMRATWGATGGDPVVGCVGTFKPGKGQLEVARAIASIRVRFPDAWLVFVGDGPERPVVERYVMAEGMDRVRFLGSVVDARPLYHGFDALVSASDAEGLPNAVLEAAAAGCPIVATDAGGTSEIVFDGSTGLLVPVGDSPKLAQSVASVLQDRALAQRLGSAARDHAMREFGVDRFVSATAALYEEMSAGHAR